MSIPKETQPPNCPQCRSNELVTRRTLYGSDEGWNCFGESCRESGNFTTKPRTVPPPTPDPVEHPAHYTSHPSGVECIEITRHMSFNLGNAMKYIWRAGLKDSTKTIQDLRKAAFYIEDEIKRLNSKQP